jgi:hypothetical protein
LEENVNGRDRLGHDKLLGSQLIRKFSQIFSHRIDGHRRLCFAGARAVLVRASDMARTQPAGGSGGKIAAVRRHHHALRRFDIEGFAGSEVNARLRFVIACNFGTQDGIPGEIVAAVQDRPSMKYFRSKRARAEIFS